MSDEIDYGSVIGSFMTGMALGDDFFTGYNKEMPIDDYILLPINTELFYKCKGLITEPGIYKFELTVTKIK